MGTYCGGHSARSLTWNPEFNLAPGPNKFQIADVMIPTLFLVFVMNLIAKLKSQANLHTSGSANTPVSGHGAVPWNIYHYRQQRGVNLGRGLVDFIRDY